MTIGANMAAVSRLGLSLLYEPELRLPGSRGRCY